jgi:biopolymer transport protein ExbB
MSTQLAEGGFLLLLIGACSVAALGIALERMYALRRSRVAPDGLFDRVIALARAGGVDEAIEACGDDESALGRVLVALLKLAGRSRARVKEAAEEVGRSEAARLERFVEGLATVATVAPLLGLLGTVLGMIEAFQEAELHGFGNPTALASGIWKALITTAAGLAVAIPAFLVYRALLSRIDRFVDELEELAQRLLDVIAEDDA